MVKSVHVMVLLKMIMETSHLTGYCSYVFENNCFNQFMNNGLLLIISVSDIFGHIMFHISK
ncbi:hypothetical protein Hdeb2414_s0138g00809881 [Helianthus debilis subsp. tardiflorus]